MQYRNLNLDKLQAFAPDRKMIDKENIYNAFLGLGDALQKGADAYTLNKIYQLSPEEQQRKMAEYRAYKGDFSGFDNIEQTKLRQAEMDALKEQQRLDEEDENAKVQRDKEHSYNALTREYDVLTNKLLNNMKKFNRENSDTSYRDWNNIEVQIKFLKEQDTGLLQDFITNYTEKEKLGYEQKNGRATIEDVFGLKKSDSSDLKRAEDKVDSGGGGGDSGAEDKVDSGGEEIIVDDFTFDTSEEIQKYLENENYKTNRGLTDDRKEKMKKYITNSKKYKLYKDKVIKDDLSDDEINKIENIGFVTITQEDVDKLKKQAEVAAAKAKAQSLAGQELKANMFGEPMKDESFDEFFLRLEKLNLTARDKKTLNEILKKYKLR